MNILLVRRIIYVYVYSLLPGIRELMLPDSSKLFDDHNILDSNIDPLQVIQDIKSLLISPNVSNVVNRKELIEVSTTKQLLSNSYLSMKILAIDNNLEEMDHLLGLSKQLHSVLDVPLPIAVYNEYLRICFESGKYDKIESLFNNELIA